MSPPRTPMSPTLIPGERVRMLPPSHPGCQPLGEAGVQFAGLDWRPPGRVWGEGLSRTLLLFWVAEGRVALDGDDLSAEAGTCLVIPPTVPKRLRTDATGVRAAWLHLEWRRPWTRFGSAAQVIETPRARHLAEWMSAVEDELATGTSPLTVHLTRAVLAACTDLGHERSARTADPWQNLWDEVAAHPAHPWTSEGLARRAGLSRAQFHRRVLAQHGVTPGERVRRLRLDQAVLLLQTTERSTDDIATEVGYSSGFALSHALRRQVGRRPSQLR